MSLRVQYCVHIDFINRVIAVCCGVASVVQCSFHKIDQIQMDKIVYLCTINQHHFHNDWLLILLVQQVCAFNLKLHTVG